MKIVCIKNGKEFNRDPEDLDMISVDVLMDYIREIEYLEKNPLARIILDFTNPSLLKYNLINCGNRFSNRFSELIRQVVPA